MANLPTFDGNGVVNNWIAAMDAHFAKQEISPERTLQIAMVHLSQAVRTCVERVHFLYEMITGTDWAWTWVRLKFVLRGMQKQIDDFRKKADRIKTRQIIKGVAVTGIGIAIGVAFVPVTLGVLGAIGFGASGVVAGSAAAGIQAEIGSVAVGSLFALCQSAAAGGAALASVGAVGAAAGGCIAIGGTEASAKEWEKIKNQIPSYSWEDGGNFRPSPQLLAAIAKHLPNMNCTVDCTA